MVVKPNITVITPVYNGEAHIVDCLENVIEQDYPHKQHLIIDGVSTDGTRNILSDYAARYVHIRYISEKDQGISDALNKGVHAASTNIVGILNADDRYEKGVLSRAANIFCSDPSLDIIVGNCRIIGTKSAQEKIFSPSVDAGDLLKGDLLYQFPVNPSSYFYRKTLHDKVGYYSPEEYEGMDLDFLLRAFKVANAQHFDELWGTMYFSPGTQTYRFYCTGELWEVTYRLLREHTPRRPFYKFAYYFICQNLFTRYGRDRIKRFLKKIHIGNQ
jgi:glycosyltransferase involved in cell wall biosynthesis